LPLEIPARDLLLFARDREALMEFKAPAKAQFLLVSSLDGISLLRRNLRSLLADEDLGRRVFCEEGSKEVGGLSDLPSHAIVDRGRLVGLWAFDAETGSIAWEAFGKKEKVLEQAVSRTERFVKEDLGDARSFSLDSPKSRAPLIAALRGASRGR